MTSIKNLKSILKFLKLNESTISTVLGGLVIITVAILVVRYFQNTQDQGSLSDAATTFSEESPQAGGQYAVKAGDTLWAIAEEAYGSGYNWVDIARENQLTNPGQIEAGQELSLPDVEPKIATQTQEEPVEQQKSSITGASYTVEKGDSLWDIAVRAYGDGYQWVKIASENNLANPNLIHAGNVLTLPR